MTRTIAVGIAVLSLAVAGPAFAKGGSGGGGGGGGGGTGGGGGGVTQPAPPPADPAPDICEGYFDLPAWPDGSLPVVNRTNGGCVIVRHYPSGLNQLSQVVLVPGWTYTIKSNGAGTDSRVQLDFTNASTGDKASILVENGKTVIR